MGQTDRELFRGGNASGAKLDRVRVGGDVTVFSNAGVDWVQAGTGGVSTFEAVDPTVKPPWWRLPGGTNYDDSVLKLVSDRPGHWMWEPTRDMPLADYRAALEAVNVNFTPV